MHLRDGGYTSCFINCFILIHLPLCLSSSGCFPGVENHRLLNSDHSVIRREHRPRWTSCFPVSWTRGPARSSSSSFPFLSWHKEKPLFSISSTPLSRKIYKKIPTKNTYLNFRGRPEFMCFYLRLCLISYFTFFKTCFFSSQKCKRKRQS